MISRNDYAQIAVRIAANRNYAPPRVRSFLDKLTYDLADYFQSDNPSFDRDRFLIAAGTPRNPGGHTQRKGTTRTDAEERKAVSEDTKDL